MSLLDAVLAFALTMLLFATIVSTIVSTAFHALGIKEKGLKKFLKAFFDIELSKVLHAEMDHIANKAEIEISDSLRAAANDVIQTAGKETGSSNAIANSLMDKADAKKLVNCSTNELIFELKTSEFGKKVTTELKDHGEELFKRIADRYEEFGQHFSGIFKKHVHIVSTIIGMILAFAINVDSIHLITTYISNNQISLHITNPTQGTDLTTDIENKYKALSSSTVGGPENPGATGDSSATDYDPSDSLNLISSAMDELRSDSFPVGWSLFPHCPPHSTDYRCEIKTNTAIHSQLSNNNSAAKSHIKKTDSNRHLYITWFLGCLLTGILSGLGAHFWHSVLNNISNFGKKAIQS